jgi:hypothetical protein
MGAIKEQTIINQVATEFRSISGIKNAYNFAENPDTLSVAQLPAALFIPAGFDSIPKAHHNVHLNEIEVKGVLFVAPRQSKGGKLKFIENAAMPFLFLVRDKFQTEATIKNLLGLGLTQAAIVSGKYGAGGVLLTHNDIEYIGIIFTWNFIEVA